MRILRMNYRKYTINCFQWGIALVAGSSSGNAAIFVGSGGYKPPEIHAYQEDPVLNSKAQQMIKIANAINQAIKDRDIKVNDDGSLTLSDNLELLYE